MLSTGIFTAWAFLESNTNPLNSRAQLNEGVSKVGGIPYLDNDILLANKKSCSYCGDQLVFVCQVYAPVNDEHARTLYIFACNKKQCCNIKSPLTHLS